MATESMMYYYQKYHDVICIDATYRTNKYELPLVTFTGINNIGKLILFGKSSSILCFFDQVQKA
jgi:hypothetical protein